jgi:hypothetical protein
MDKQVTSFRLAQVEVKLFPVTFGFLAWMRSAHVSLATCASQAAAERNRREVVIKAEGQKRAQELQSGSAAYK